MIGAPTSRWLLGLWCVAAIFGAGLFTDDGGLLRALSDLRYRGLGIVALIEFGLDLLLMGLPAVLLGVLCGAALWQPPDVDNRTYWRGRIGGALLALVLGWCFGGLTAAEQPPGLPGWHVPGLWGAFWPSALAVFGASCFGPLPRLAGPPALRGLLRRVGVLALCAIVGSVLLYNLLIQRSPLDLPLARVESWQKRELVGLVRAHNPFRVLPGEYTTLSLRPDQLAVLLAWGATVFDPEARTRATAKDDRASFAVSLGRGGRFLNIRLDVRALWRGAETPDIAACTIGFGHLEIGGSGCAMLLGTGYSLLISHPAVDGALESLREASLDGRGLRANYGQLALGQNTKGALRRLLGPSPDVRAAVEAQLTTLRSTATRLPPGDAGFEVVLRSAFMLARERSVDGDPRVENQGALLALGGILGHHDVFTIAGLDRPADLETLLRDFRRVPLRGRPDHTRHFMVSAALTQLSNTLVADAAGLLKEELDAGGDSGFSFADLQADRAGTLFGETAVKSIEHAHELQALIANDFSLDAISPDTVGMPEKLDDAAMAARFGGVGGSGYLAITAEIERRLRSARAYREPSP